MKDIATGARVALAVVLGAACSSCAREAPADVVPATVQMARTSRIEPVTAGERAVTGWRVLARARSLAIGTNEGRVYFGDEGTRALLAAPKTGGKAVAIGVPAPRSIAFGAGSIVWIGAPGDVVLRAPREGGTADVLRERGVFTALAARDADVFIAEVSGEKGTLTRVTGPSTTRVAVLDSPPHAIVMDDTHVFVQTQTAILQVARHGDEVRRIMTGAALSRLAIDRDAVYATDQEGPSRAVLRIPKGGGGATTLEHAVRDAPIAVHQGDVYYFDGDQPTLRRVATTGGASAIVARSRDLERVTALEIDTDGIYVANEAAVIAMPLITMPR